MNSELEENEDFIEDEGLNQTTITEILSTNK